MSLWTSIRDVLKPVAAVALAPYTGGLSTAAYTAYEQGKNVPATAAVIMQARVAAMSASGLRKSPPRPSTCEE